MPRALLLCEYPALNGGERSLLAVLPTLQRAGWQFDAWCPDVGPLAEAFAALNIRVIAPRSVVDPQNGLQERRDDLAAVISTSGATFDLVHANSLSMGRLSGPVVEAACVPSLSHLRDIVGLNRTAIVDLNRHRRLLAVSGAVCKHHIAQGLAAEKCHVLYNGVDTELFKPAAPTGYLHRELGIDPERRLIGIVGQLSLRKNPREALVAAFHIGSRYSILMPHDTHVVVVGSRHSDKPETVEYERELHRLAACDDMAGRVHFLGSRDDMPQLLPELTLLIHAAKQEPLGRVLMEAAACGVPIVATKVGGTKEIFPGEAEDGAFLTSYLTASNVRDVLKNPELQLAMSISGRNRIATAFSVERSAAGLLRHYTEVAGR